MNQKCGFPSCEKKAQIFIQRRDKVNKAHLYCSVSCAGNDLNRRECLTRFAVTEKSSLGELTVVLAKPSNSENMTSKENKMKNELPTVEEMRKSGIIEIRQSFSSNQENAEKSMEKKLEQENELRQEYSLELSPNSEQGKSSQKSLIDDSITSMHLLTKHVIKKVQQADDVNPAQVNAACNAAKQVHSLLKLKLEIYKEMKK